MEHSLVRLLMVIGDGHSEGDEDSLRRQEGIRYQCTLQMPNPGAMLRSMPRCNLGSTYTTSTNNPIPFHSTADEPGVFRRKTTSTNYEATCHFHYYYLFAGYYGGYVMALQVVANLAHPTHLYSFHPCSCKWLNRPG